MKLKKKNILGVEKIYEMEFYEVSHGKPNQMKVLKVVHTRR